MFHVSRLDDAAVVEITGEIDHGSCRQFSAILTSDAVISAAKVIVSLADCTYIDSACLGSLIGAQRRLNRRLVVVVRPQTIPSKILSLASFGTFFRVHDNLQSAREAA